jgi:hypothetical protein
MAKKARTLSTDAGQIIAPEPKAEEMKFEPAVVEPAPEAPIAEVTPEPEIPKAVAPPEPKVEVQEVKPVKVIPVGKAKPVASNNTHTVRAIISSLGR